MDGLEVPLGLRLQDPLMAWMWKEVTERAAEATRTRDQLCHAVEKVASAGPVPGSLWASRGHSLWASALFPSAQAG